MASALETDGGGGGDDVCVLAGSHMRGEAKRARRGARTGARQNEVCGRRADGEIGETAEAEETKGARKAGWCEADIVVLCGWRVGVVLVAIGVAYFTVQGFLGRDIFGLSSQGESCYCTIYRLSLPLLLLVFEVLYLGFGSLLDERINGKYDSQEQKFEASNWQTIRCAIAGANH